MNYREKTIIYTYLGVDIPKDCLWDGHIHSKSNTGKGKTHVGKMDAIITDPHLGTRIKCALPGTINVFVLKLEYAGEV